MSEMNLKQSGFTYSACGAFTKSKERMQKFKETGHSRYICQNKLEKVCFQQGMAYGDFKGLIRKSASDKILGHLILHLILLKIRNMMDINVDLLQRSMPFLVFFVFF